MNPLLQTNRARDEKRDQCLSVLEICRKFVSWRGTRSLLSLRRSSLPRVICPFSDCERKLRFFLVRLVQYQELSKENS
jgi:hypothetical protein